MNLLFTFLQSSSSGDGFGQLFVVALLSFIGYKIFKKVRDSIEENERQEEYRRNQAEKEAKRKNHEAMVLEWKNKVIQLEDEHFPVAGTSRTYGLRLRSNTTNDQTIIRFRSALDDLKKNIEAKYSDSLSYSECSNYYSLLNKYKTSSMKLEEERKARALEEQKRRAEEAKRQAERIAAERKREAEKARKRELASKFKYITLGGFKAAYSFDYYPKNRYPSVTPEQENNRRSVWNFKDGSYSIGLLNLKNFIDGNFTSDQMRNIVVCVIPASTQYKNDVRYKTLCQKISEQLPVANGYNYISIVHDRSDSREHKSSNTIENLSFSSSVRGKDIILFDDITTRGTSFIQVANELKNKGANSVCGFFLGKTVSSIYF